MKTAIIIALIVIGIIVVVWFVILLCFFGLVKNIFRKIFKSIDEED